MTINYQYKNIQSPVKITLTEEQTAGHADHWHILTNDISNDVPQWLQAMIEHAAIPKGLNGSEAADSSFANSGKANSYLLLSENNTCHINQVLAMSDGKPQNFVNAYPCVNSPYGLSCRIERIIANDSSQDAVLRLCSEDGSIIYAFDQLYTTNRYHYRQGTNYFVNFSAWAYEISKSDESEVILVEDPEAIRYHRAFNDIVANNDGQVPVNMQELIRDWQPDSDKPLAPVEINLGNMCAYLFGETLGQEDEAWCQGQVLGKQEGTFNGVELTLFDVVILREHEAAPFVVRMAAMSNDTTKAIAVHDYVQANIWLQAAIHGDNQQDA
jgi:hypothetical protein